MSQGEKKYTYYLTFSTQLFLGAKELLKSMPTFYNKIYFSSKYARALWSGDIEETFTNVTILTEQANMATLRQIIKTNFLYISEWDSTRYTEGEEFGFSFIAGNIKYVLMPFVEVDDGYVIRSYDVDTGNCYETTLVNDKKRFLSSSMKENGDIVRICDFNLEYMTDANTKVQLAQKKAQVANMATFTAGRDGYALANTIAILSIALASVATVLISYYIVSAGGLG